MQAKCQEAEVRVNNPHNKVNFSLNLKINHNNFNNNNNNNKKKKLILIIWKKKSSRTSI